MTRIRTGAAFAFAAILFAACQGTATSPAPTAAPSGPPASTAPSAAPSSAIKEGGKLVVALPGDIKRTDPAMIDDSNSSYVMQNVMEGLVALKPGSTSEIVPSLATKWTISPDGLTYTFDLREGVKFHDGTDLNADAVKYNYDRWKNFPKELQDYTYYAGAVFGGYGDTSNVASVTASSPTQVVIVLKRPNSSFLVAQTLTVFGISSPAALKAGGGDNTVLDVSKIPYAQGGAGAMVGTGPFKFKSWTVGDNVTIDKNPDYWNKDALAHVDQVIFKPVAEETQILNGLQNGEIDIAQKVAPVDLATLTANPALQAIDRGQSCNTAQISMNHKYKPISNPKIREAIAYAVNKQSYIDAFYAGQAVAADNWMPLNTQYAKPLGLPTYDVQKAKDAIAASGETDLTIDFYYPSDVTRPYMPDPKGLFEAVTRDLEAVGFKINPHTETWSPDYLDHEYAGNFEMWLLGWTCDWAGADNFLKTAFFGYVKGAPSTEFAYKNDELEKTMNDALAATDEATAKTLWEHAQDLLKADLPTVPLINSTPPAAAQSYIKGFVGSGALNEYLNTVWIDK
ncbi:MAG: peptide/nickel transport system substrate-binding protein [Chloroflexota bacterium]|jgi:peptide/nickel transport system substrate-binding protein|nr:peptide/nickel transport system substrate-binding protein [Chloroflexota bacterium]